MFASGVSTGPTQWNSRWVINGSSKSIWQKPPFKTNVSYFDQRIMPIWSLVGSGETSTVHRNHSFASHRLKNSKPDSGWSSGTMWPAA